MRHAIAAAILLLSAHAALAANQATGELTVSVNVVESCHIQSAGNTLSFGNVAQDAGTARAETNVTVRCSRDRPYTLGFDYGRHAQGTQRHMDNGSAQIAYQLYAGDAGARPVGPLNSGAEVHGVGNGKDEQIPVYGSLDLAKQQPAGQYSDVVYMTIAW
ncbi:MAG TPA: spore coat U domain-containing protein [Mizugakiibacter sp.]